MPAFEAIASTTIGSTTSTVTFSSIPNTYEHLQLRVYGRNSDTASNRFMTLQFNGATGSSYTRRYFVGDGSSVSAATSNSDTYITVGQMAANSALANTFGCAIIDILDYANSLKYTTVKAVEGFDSNGSGYVHFASGLWMNLDAVTETKLGFASGSFLAGTVVALYGLRSS